MSTVTVPAPARQRQPRKPRPKPVRFCKLSGLLTGDFLSIREVFARKPEAIDLYRVECFPSDLGGRGIELTKKDGTRYHVELQGKASTCTCPGFESHGWHIDRATGELVACKHIMALLKLESEGRLNARTSPPATSRPAVLSQDAAQPVLPAPPVSPVSPAIDSSSCRHCGGSRVVRLVTRGRANVSGCRWCKGS